MKLAQRNWRVVWFLPLLALAPLGYFSSFYCAGFGFLPDGIGFLLGGVSMFVLPWLVALAVSVACSGTRFLRFGVLLGSLVAQVFFTFTLSPPGATAEMMGIAHRLRREFVPKELAECAEAIRQKHREGTIKIRTLESTHGFLLTGAAVGIADSELPDSIRGKFHWVAIDSGSGSGFERVCFALGSREGIVCDDRAPLQGPHFYSLAEGVHAYRYLRP